MWSLNDMISLVSEEFNLKDQYYIYLFVLHSEVLFSRLGRVGG